MFCKLDNKKYEVNLKRRNFYKTEQGKKVKKDYKEKAALKRKILNTICEMTLSKKADIQRETIEKLLALL